MTLPDTVEGALGEEEAVASVSLGGEDLLVVTPSRTLVYRAEGLLSDEQVEEFGHDVDRLSVNEGRRKAKLTLEYGLDGTRTITVPGGSLDDVLHPILAGVISAAGVTDPGESVLRTFRFSELTLVVTDERIVKHIGSATWDEEFEEFGFDEVTDLDFEEGTVATSVVLTLGGRQERFKTPNEQARAVRETLTDAVCEYHDVGSLEELRLTVGADEADDSGSDPADFGAGPDPLDTSGVEGDPDAADADAAGGGSASAAEGGSDPAGSQAGGDTAGTIDPDPSAAGDAASAAASDAGGDGATSGSTGADGTGDATGAGGRSTRSTADSTGGTASGDGSADAGGASTAPIETGDDADAFEEAGFEQAVDRADLADEVARLRATVEEQSERLDRQAELIEQLVQELRRGR